MFFEFRGGKYRGQNGAEMQVTSWWPMAVGQWIDSFFRTLMGRGTLGIPSTMTLVKRSMNMHSPVDQKISLFMVDADNPRRLLWGTDLNANHARNIAMQLMTLAEEIDPTPGLMEKSQKFLESWEKENVESRS